MSPQMKRLATLGVVGLAVYLSWTVLHNRKVALVSALPTGLKAVLFEEVYRNADFIGIVEIVAVPGRRYLESNPPTIVCRVKAVLRGESKPGSSIPILWQTKADQRACFADADTDNTIHLPSAGEYLVYLRRHKGAVFERFSEAWSFQRIPVVPNVVMQQLSLMEKKWRALTEVSPFISEVGDKVRYRFYRTRVDEETFEGDTYNFSADVLTVIDYTRKRVLSPKDPGTRIKAHESVPRGRTVIHEIELTRHFDLSQPGEYWILNGDGLLRFEVSDKVLIRTPEK